MRLNDRLLIAATLVTIITAHACKDRTDGTIVQSVTSSSVQPKSVYNKCANKWAVMTETLGVPYKKEGRMMWSSYNEAKVPTFWGQGIYLASPDTVDDAELGKEFTFSDSTTAMKAYNIWLAPLREAKRLEDSLNARLRFMADSTFNCQHTYQ